MDYLYQTGIILLVVTVFGFFALITLRIYLLYIPAYRLAQKSNSLLKSSEETLAVVNATSARVKGLREATRSFIISRCTKDKTLDVCKVLCDFDPKYPFC